MHLQVEHFRQDRLALLRRADRVHLPALLVLHAARVVAQAREVHVQQAARHLPLEAQVLREVRPVAHERVPVALVAELDVLEAAAGPGGPVHRAERLRAERAHAAVRAVHARVHEAQRAEAREVEQHDARADAVRVVPLRRAHLGVRRDRDRGGGRELREAVPEQRGVRDEERVGVDEDGARDGRGEDLVDEELHEAGWGPLVSARDTLGDAGTYGRRRSGRS